MVDVFFTEEQLQDFEQTRWRYLKVGCHGPVMTITLARPEKRNAFTPLMADEIAFAFAYAGISGQVRCVLLQAEGPVFCAGADLGAFHDPAIDGEDRSVPVPLRPVTLGDVFSLFHKPCVARVQGAVLAGGFLLIAGCTIVYCTQEATFSLPEVKRGIWPMQVMAALLPLMPSRKILEMCITGNTYTAAEAYEMGLVTQVYPREAIDDKVYALVRLICENAPLAIREGIAAMRRLPEIPEADKHRWLKGQLDLLVNSEDAREGLAAFREKRAPQWKGR